LLEWLSWSELVRLLNIREESLGFHAESAAEGESTSSPCLLTAQEIVIAALSAETNLLDVDMGIERSNAV
jgi:hypothetical protein